MSKKVYNHDADSITEACGITEEELGALVKKTNDIQEEVSNTEGGSKSSVVIERFATDLTPDELAILLYLVQRSLGELKESLSHMFGETPEA